MFSLKNKHEDKIRSEVNMVSVSIFLFSAITLIWLTLCPIVALAINQQPVTSEPIKYSGKTVEAAKNELIASEEVRNNLLASSGWNEVTISRSMGDSIRKTLDVIKDNQGPLKEKDELENKQQLPLDSIDTTKYITELVVSTSPPRTLTEDEKNMLIYLINAEARGRSYEMKVAVGQVVMNRWESGKYGSDLLAIMTAPHQFTPIYNKSAFKKPIEPLSVDAAEAVICGYGYKALTSDTYYFINPEYTKDKTIERKTKFVCEIEDMHFYRP